MTGHARYFHESSLGHIVDFRVPRAKLARLAPSYKKTGRIGRPSHFRVTHIPKWRPVSFPIYTEPNVKSPHLNDLLAVRRREVKPPSGIRIRCHPGVEQRNSLPRPCAATDRVSAVSVFAAIRQLRIPRYTIGFLRKHRGNKRK